MRARFFLLIMAVVLMAFSPLAFSKECNLDDVSLNDDGSAYLVSCGMGSDYEELGKIQVDEDGYSAYCETRSEHEYFSRSSKSLREVGNWIIDTCG